MIRRHCDRATIGEIKSQQFGLAFAKRSAPHLVSVRGADHHRLTNARKFGDCGRMPVKHSIARQTASATPQLDVSAIGG